MRSAARVQIPPSPPSRSKFVLLRLIFYLRRKASHSPLLCSYSFFKKSRSVPRLFRCKYPYDNSLSLPASCEFKGLPLTLKNDNIFFAWLRHVAASCISFAATFLQKSPARSFSCVSFCEKGHAPPLVLVCKRALADETCF